MFARATSAEKSNVTNLVPQGKAGTATSNL